MEHACAERDEAREERAHALTEKDAVGMVRDDAISERDAACTLTNKACAERDEAKAEASKILADLMQQQTKNQNLVTKNADLDQQLRRARVDLRAGLHIRALRVKASSNVTMKPSFSTSTAMMDVYRAIKAACKAELKNENSELHGMQSKSQIVDMGIWLLALRLGINFHKVTGVALSPGEQGKKE